MALFTVYIEGYHFAVSGLTDSHHYIHYSVHCQARGVFLLFVHCR